MWRRSPKEQAGYVKGESNRGTFNLRRRLAQDGCPESQFIIAKILLNESGNKEERRINAILAVNWLLQASSKGHAGALKLLRQCSDSGIGVNVENCFAVEKILNLSKEQILARRIAVAIMGDAEECVAEDYFQEKVETILTEDEKEPAESIEESIKNLSISEDLFELSSSGSGAKGKESCEPSTVNEPSVSLGDVISSVQQCLEGKLPLVTLRVSQYEKYNKWLSLKYLYKLSTMMRSALIALVKDVGSLDFMSTLILCLLFLSMFHSSFTVGYAASLLGDKVVLCAIIGFLVMMSCSCYIVHLNIGFDNVTRWLDLIWCFEPRVNTEYLIEKYLRQSVCSFFIFFIASIVFNVLYPFITVSLISRELFMLAVVMLVLLHRTITCERYYVNISLFLNLVLCLNKVKANLFINSYIGWLSYLNFEFCFTVYDEYEIHLNLLSLFTLLFALPYLYVRMAFSQERKGWYLVLFPHLLSLTWLNFACSFYSPVEPDFILYSMYFWFVVLFFTNYIGAIASLMIVSSIKVSYVVEVLPSVSSFITLFLLVFLFLVSSFFINKLKLVFKTIVIFVALYAIFLSVLLLRMPLSHKQIASEAVLPWAKYEAYCYRRAWYQSNIADVEISCLPLKGKQISVEGTVVAIDLVAVHNSVKFLTMLPSPISDWLTCALGVDLCHKENMSHLEIERCSVFNNVHVSRCSLNNWDSYEYRIRLEVSSRTSPEVIIKVGHLCSSFVRALKEGDSLHIVGELYGGIGSIMPEILLEHAICNTCYELTECPVSQVSNDTKFDFKLSFNHIIKFYFVSFIQPKGT